MIYNSVTELIGETPLLRLHRLAPEKQIYAKLEFFNPGGSVKDRIALNMIEKAEEKEQLYPGGTIVEPTSGNTGIGLALAAAVKGYNVILVMPDTMSKERRQLLQTLGAELLLTPGVEGMTGAVDRAKEIVDENPGYYMPSQFDNPANPGAHRKTTARELSQELDEIDVLVVGVGTGGTLTGTASRLKEDFPELKVIAVEPEDSPVLSGKEAGPHMIQGIGAGFIPEVLEEELIDDIITISNKEAYSMSQQLGRQEGLLAGISSGANVAAALKIAKDLPESETIVTFIPDTGERYLSLQGAFNLNSGT